MDDLRRYTDHLLACFGPQRLMWGSDWPVVNLAGGYARWREAALALLADLPDRGAERGARRHRGGVLRLRLTMPPRTAQSTHDRISRGLALDERAIEESFVHASGPGGQNVNKVATAVQLRVDLARTGLPDAVLAAAAAPGRAAADPRRGAADHRPAAPHAGPQPRRGAGDAGAAGAARRDPAQAAHRHQAYRRLPRAPPGRQGASRPHEKNTFRFR